MNMKLIVSASEAAVLLRERPAKTLERLEAGELPAYREGTAWKIPYELLKNYVEAKALAETRTRRKLGDEMIIIENGKGKTNG